MGDVVFFFFSSRRRHTRLQGDWSSDVCSSDLNHYWVKIKGRHSVPANAYPIAIHAKQFEWQVTYPGADGQLGTSDDFTVRNQLHVPVGRPVVVHLSSEDVIHSFFVPVFRVKQDAVPGM